MNIFSFPKLSSTGSDKIISSKILKIGVIIVICFIASLFVQGLVSDRINRANRAVDNLIGLKKFNYDPRIFVRDTSPLQSGEYRSGDTPLQLFDNLTITVENTSVKTLGNQEILVFKGTATSKGKATFETTYFDSTDKSYLYVITIPKGIEIDTASIKVNESVFKNFTLSSNKDSILIKTNTIPKDSTIELSYAFTGVNSMSFYTYPEKPYDVKVVTTYENIRLVNSANSSYNKDKTVDIKINPSDEETGILFFAGSDDITFVDRILKYAILFIILVFAFALYFDFKKGLTVNIVQYFLIGMSLALFYLLVLSLGEHTGYLTSYITASLVTVLLNGWYTKEVFDSKKIGMTFGSILLLLYIILYYLIRLTSINLLLGTCILYLILILFMLGSKHLNKTSTP